MESTMICFDASEWLRNGDMPPTRFCSEQEAVRALIHYKLRANPENAVGLIAMSDTVEMLSSVTRDDRSLIIKLHGLSIKGTARVFMRTLKTAYLALRHRPNPHSRARIVMFIGSPLEEMESEYKPGDFIKLAKKYKKEKLSVDFVLFGEAATSDKNQAVAEFVDTINGKDGATSHLVVVPPGEARLYDIVLRSDICRGTGGLGGVVGANGGGVPQGGLGADMMMDMGAGGGIGIGAGVGLAGDFGGAFGGMMMDDEEDPELQLALRISLEESRQHHQQQQGEGRNGGVSGAGPTLSSADVGCPESEIKDAGARNITLTSSVPVVPQIVAPGTTALPLPDQQQQSDVFRDVCTTEPKGPMSMDLGAMTEDEQMEYALRMSMTGDESPSTDAVAAPAGVTSKGQQQQINVFSSGASASVDGLPIIGFGGTLGTTPPTPAPTTVVPSMIPTPTAATTPSSQPVTAKTSGTQSPGTPAPTPMEVDDEDSMDSTGRLASSQIRGGTQQQRVSVPSSSSNSVAARRAAIIGPDASAAAALLSGDDSSSHPSSTAAAPTTTTGATTKPNLGHLFQQPDLLKKLVEEMPTRRHHPPRDRDSVTGPPDATVTQGSKCDDEIEHDTLSALDAGTDGTPDASRSGGDADRTGKSKPSASSSKGGGTDPGNAKKKGKK